jgi:hypothetical protein
MSEGVGAVSQLAIGEVGKGSDYWRAVFCDPLSACWQLGIYRKAFGELVAFMDSVLNTEQVPFKVVNRGRRKCALRTVAEVPDKRNLSTFFPNFVSFIDLYQPGQAYSPDLQLFFGCFLRHPEFGYCWPSCFPQWTLVDERIAGEAFNDFIAELRLEARRHKVRRRLETWKRGLVAQERSIRKKLWLWTQGYGRLLLLRMEFFYGETAGVMEDAMPRMSWQTEPDGRWNQVPVRSWHGVPEARPRIDSGLAMQHRERFFDNQRGGDAALLSIWRPISASSKTVVGIAPIISICCSCSMRGT